MHFTTKDKAAIWSLVKDAVKDIKTLEQEDHDALKTAKRIKVLQNFLKIDEEVESISKRMKNDTYVPYIAEMSSEQKEYVTCILLMIISANEKVTEDKVAYYSQYIKICELPNPTDEKKDEIFDEFYAYSLKASQSANNTSNSSNTHDWQFYQKKFTDDFEKDAYKFKWNKIIPLTAQEAIGAMEFCKVYLNDEHHHMLNMSDTTLERIIDLCDEEYANDPEVRKVLPKYKEALKQYKEKERERKEKKEKKKRFILILWAIALILVILQIIFWGWWTILSGIVTMGAAGIIHLLID